MKTVTPFNYPERVSFPEAYRYGRYFHIATLKDGRDIAFSADKVLVTGTGDLLAMSNSVYNQITKEREEVEPKTILCLARGEWLSFYAASVMDGDPIGVEWVEGTKSDA